MVRGILNGNVAGQPQDMSIARFNLGLVLVVRLNVSVRNGVSVVRIRLMDMLRRDCGGGDHPGRKRENEGQMPD